MGNPIINIFKAMQHNGLESALSRYYSAYRGIVYDREDPEGLNRLRLVIPDITGEDFLPIWAYPKGVFYGKGYGMQVMPKRGDLVWVEFEQGDPNVPMWSHGYPGAEERPNDPELDDLDCYWFKTPGGHLVKLNDTSGAITIERTGGDKVIMDKDGVSIITNKDINHGTDSPKYSHVLGEELSQQLTDLTEAVQELATAQSQDIAMSTGGTFLLYAFMAKQVPQTLPKIAKALAQIKKILSSHVKLDK